MSAHDFTIWLRGFLEAAGNAPSPQQVELIVAALKRVAPPVVAQPGPSYRPLDGARSILMGDTR